MIPIEYILVGFSLLLILSILASKLSYKLGIPSLLLFLAIGMLAGSDGPGKIYFDNAPFAQSLGVMALSFILFSGGLDTNWKSVKPVLWKGVALSTVGVLLTALFVGIFSVLVLKFSLLEGLLLGAIISSTDAAAVFAVLRSKRVSLKGDLKPLLEFESGSNDPMAVFLTIGVISIITGKNSTPLGLILMFVQQMAIGGALGYGAGRLTVYLVKKLSLEYEGLYPVLTIAMVLITYGLAASIGGNGFLAAYIAGLIVGNSVFMRKNDLSNFHEGVAWLMQIVMFITLGLLVFPSHLPAVALVGLLAALFLMFVARPLSVFASLAFSKMRLREKAFVSWVGLRGAAPIVLATFPLIAGVQKAGDIFNMVFFIVIMSFVLQGPSIPLLAKWLKVDAPLKSRRRYPIAFEQTEEIDGDLDELEIPQNSAVIGKRISELNFHKSALIVIINKNNKFVVPMGDTVLGAGDVLLVLADGSAFKQMREIIETAAAEPAKA